MREEAKKVQYLEQQKRQSGAVLNVYVPGDLVLFDEASKGMRDKKLSSRFSGPYLVTSVYKSDIACKHIVTGKEKVFHMENLKPFVGDFDEAYHAAKTDDDQFLIITILDYVGEPEKRSDMRFFVKFEGSEDLWLDYNQDLANSKPFLD